MLAVADSMPADAGLAGPLLSINDHGDRDRMLVAGGGESERQVRKGELINSVFFLFFPVLFSLSLTLRNKPGQRVRHCAGYKT